MEQRTLKNVNNCLNADIYTYSETSGGQSSNLYLNVVHFSTTVLIRQLWKLRPCFSALVSNTCCSIVHNCTLNFGSVNEP